MKDDRGVIFRIVGRRRAGYRPFEAVLGFLRSDWLNFYIVRQLRHNRRIATEDGGADDGGRIFEVGKPIEATCVVALRTALVS
jgi:hypothetical protein